jgi:hypothetical protein
MSIPMRATALTACLTLTCLAGCFYGMNLEPTLTPPGIPPSPVPTGGVPNPLTISNVNPEFLWEQLVDMVDDYFQIASEQRMQNLGGLLTEGKIETRYIPGATFLEPWNLDSASAQERLLATLQSVRRRATIKVVPTGGNYVLNLVVDRDLEDVDYPAYALPGSSTIRHDGSLVRLLDSKDEGPKTMGWIPLGRDVDLEQEMLRELNSRLAESPVPP